MNEANVLDSDHNHENTDALAKAGLRLQLGEMRRTHIDLNEQRDHYTNLYNFAPTGYLTLTVDGMIVEGNFAAAKLLGIAHNKLCKRRFSQFIAEQCKDLWNRHCLLTEQSEDIHSCELSLFRADGITLYVQLNSVYKQVLDEPPLLLVTLNDITGYKQVDEALRIAAVAFETQDGIIVTDPNKIILRVNEAFTRITGFDPKEVLGNIPFFLRQDQQDERYQPMFWATMLNDGYWQGEAWEKRKNGETFPVWLTLTAVIDTDGCVSHYVCSFTDITAQKQAEKILLEARYRLENQVTTTKEELEKVKKETAEINAALTVVLKHQESNKTQAQQVLSREVEETILPFLKKLKGASTGRVQSSQLLSVLEVNLLQLVRVYGRTGTIPDALQKLTPLEVQVASMVRQGLSTKAIAKTLNITEGTVSIHRNNIRRKLGLNKTADNLQIYLKSLLD
jgi:PAS domain S-box-containing protein